jgi:hypothetical protein
MSCVSCIGAKNRCENELRWGSCNSSQSDKMSYDCAHFKICNPEQSNFHLRTVVLKTPFYCGCDVKIDNFKKQIFGADSIFLEKNNSLIMRARKFINPLG